MAIFSTKLSSDMHKQGSEVVVLGTAQDGGIPQLGCTCSHCNAAWEDETQRKLVASLAIVDHPSRQLWLIDATPDIREQMQDLSSTYPDYRLAGILLTHAHIGHYLGLASLGREVWNQNRLLVFATQRMIEFLRTNQPWKQLVDLNNISLSIVNPEQPVRLGSATTVKSIPVTHRDELSDTIAFSIEGPTKRLVYCPDIDGWEGSILEAIKDADVALLDGTFYSEDELPGRNASEIPHPCIVDSIEMFSGYETQIQFIHLNHSNLLLSDDMLLAELKTCGFDIGERGNVWKL
jgi:pyrroloquinoline quinone biosynthesis protein B